MRPFVLTLCCCLLLPLAAEEHGSWWPPFLPRDTSTTQAPVLEPIAKGEVVTIAGVEMAGISGFREHWNQPLAVAPDGATRIEKRGNFGEGPSAVWGGEAPGAPVIDAVHRSLLLRFPDAAERLAAALAAGKRVARLEIVLPFQGTEYWPVGYKNPSGMSFIGDKWRKHRYTWHAIAWPLRRAWASDPRHGPTFNAAVDGKVYWARFGAADTQHDRFPQHFGPVEVSHRQEQGYGIATGDTPAGMDVTAILTDETYGASLGERLRQLSDRGFLLRKWEVYDAALWKGGYEWTEATGHRGILLGAPSLRVTLVPGSAQTVDLPRPADPAAPARGGTVGEPTAVLPDDAGIRELIAAQAPTQPEWMPDWQWKRYQEMMAVTTSSGTSRGI